MRRFLRRLWRRRRRRAAAVTILVLALASAGYGIAVVHTWSSCRNSKVRSYPHAYPQCHASAQTARPMDFAAAGGIALVLAVGGVYLLVSEPGPRPSARRR
jgi:hypothetical protein